MPDLLYDRVMFAGLDEAIKRLRAFAQAHNDFEPSLECERAESGARRWALTVVRRTAEPDR
jgi:hypothetical protein